MTRGGAKQAQKRLILALDTPWAESKKWLSRLHGEIWGMKVGSILFTEKGPRVVEKILEQGFSVFLDLKFHDIPNTVQHAVRQAFSWGVDMVSVHASGGLQMLEAAAAEQKKSSQRVLAISVLTSLDQKNLLEIGAKFGVVEQVARLANLAAKSGVRGLVCSPKEVGQMKKAHPKLCFVTPGVRFGNTAKQDQKRTEDAVTTFRSGADFAVVGRALTTAENWKKEWRKITSSLDEIS